MAVLTNARHEIFTQNWLLGKPITECAILAGYTPSRAAQTASRLVRYGNILARYTELQEKKASNAIADIQERQRILTEIARGNLLDYQEVGADGGYLSIGKESPNTRSISEITSRTEYDNNGAGAAVVTKVKLHNPVNAIEELNKMDGVYKVQPAGQTFNTTMNIIVMDGETKALITQVKERTAKLIEGNAVSTLQ